MKLVDTFRAEIQDLGITDQPLNEEVLFKGAVAERAGGTFRIMAGSRAANDKPESIEDGCQKQDHESKGEIRKHVPR